MRNLPVAVLAALSLTVAAEAGAHPNPKVPGTLSGIHCSWLCLGHPDRSITGTNVWCRWDGDHVQVHVTFRNSSNSDLVATVRPNYWIAGYGRHGSSIGSSRKVDLSAGSYLDWLTDSGHPQGVPTGTRIERCAPALETVVTGNDGSDGGIVVNL